MRPSDREYLDSVSAQSKRRLARIIDLEDALEAIAAMDPQEAERAREVAKAALAGEVI